MSTKRKTVKKKVVCRSVCKPVGRKRTSRQKAKVQARRRVRPPARFTANVTVPVPKVEVTAQPPVVPAPVTQVTVPVPSVEVAAPPPVVVPAPIAQVTVPVPDVEVEVAAPPPVVIPAPIVQVTATPGDVGAALREALRSHTGSLVELIILAGPGAGGDVPNRIGLLESVGEGTVSIRPTVGNPDQSQIVYYSLAQVAGFRPSAPVLPDRTAAAQGGI